jgi:hypothetical protein
VCASDRLVDDRQGVSTSRDRHDLSDPQCSIDVDPLSTLEESLPGGDTTQLSTTRFTSTRSDCRTGALPASRSPQPV